MEPGDSHASWCVIESGHGALKGGALIAHEVLSVAPVEMFEQEPVLPNETLEDAQRIPISHYYPRYIVRGTLPGIYAGYFDVDFYRVDLDPGDVLSMRVVPMVQESSLDPMLSLLRERDSGTNYGQVFKSNIYGTFSGAYPPGSPLLTTRDESGRVIHLNTAVSEFVAQQSITLYLRVTTLQGSRHRDYAFELMLLRPSLEGERSCDVQKIFLDFDGHDLNVRDTFGFGSNASLSPMRDFLGAWGLTPDDEDELLDGVVDRVTENLASALVSYRGAEILVLNSRDHADPGDDPLTTRVVVGGTRHEIGLHSSTQAIGLAQSIDPGNFVHDEVAVVLLDSLSSDCSAEEASDPDHPCTMLEHEASLANVEYAPGFSRLEGVARGLGNIVSHELAHLLGAWHSDPTNGQRRVMDSGWTSLRENIYGVGLDGILGSEDDQIPSFESDSYDPSSSIHRKYLGSSGVQFVSARLASALADSSDSCSADLNGDSRVDGADLGILLGAWGEGGCPYDLNSDARVDTHELRMVIEQWGVCP